MTPGRRLGALATLGILLLSACSTTDTQGPEAGGVGATSTVAPDLERDPHPGAPLPEAATDGMWLPLPFQDAQILDPGWGRDVRYADGVFLGVTDHGDRLTYAAVDVHGELLWEAERPMGSPDVDLRSDEQGRLVAVLPDSAPEGTSTVSGYDLATGDLAWGPEEPPGPGTPEPPVGVVPDPAAGDTSGTTADPSEGAAESKTQTFEDPTTMTLISMSDTTLRAEDPEGTELWSLSITADTNVAGLAGGLLYLREGDAIRTHNVVTGTVAQAYDAEGEGRVVVPRMMVTGGATLLIDGDRSLIATAPEAPPAPEG